MLHYHRALRLAEGVEDTETRRWLIAAIRLKHESEVLQQADPLVACLHTLAKDLSTMGSLEDACDTDRPLFWDTLHERWYYRSQLLLDRWDVIFPKGNPYHKPGVRDYDLVMEVIAPEPSFMLKRDDEGIRVKYFDGSALKEFILQLGVRIEKEIMRTL